MTENKAKLLQLLRERSFKLGEFTLASGDKSDYYIDGKMSEICSEGAYLIGQVLYDATKDLEIDAIGGLEAGAIPLTTATVISYHQHGRSLEGFWVRDKVKGHGTKKAIEGKLESSMRVVIVDDVFTRGNSAMKALVEVEKLGCEVVCVIALVDRNQGARRLFEEKRAEYRPIFTIDDLRAVPDVCRETEVAAR